MRKLFISILSICFGMNVSAAKIEGKITVMQPSRIKIESVTGQNILTVDLPETSAFSHEANITPDIYKVWFGQNPLYIYLDNSDLNISGFLDDKNADDSQIEIKELTANDLFTEIKKKSLPDVKKINDFNAQINQQNVDGKYISALYFIYSKEKSGFNPKYENSKLILESIKPEYRNSASYNYLSNEVDSLKKYAIGGPVPDVIAVDVTGKKVSLSDFRGKYVIIDFWASWCGPCRAEIKHIREFYPQFKDRSDIVFISVSMDDDKESWMEGLKKVEIPWVSLWSYNENAANGHKAGFKDSVLKEDFGFKSIPFVAIIDKEGNYIARELKSQQIKTTLENLK